MSDSIKNTLSNREKSFSKIMIFGRPGSGKSTFSLWLHRKTNIPLYHLDKHFYESGWKERDHDEFLKIQRQILSTSKWIVDGNNLQSLEMRYSEAEIALYFSYPRWQCYLRILKRIVHKNKEIKDRAENCPERIQWKLLKYIWGFEKRVHPTLVKLLQKYPRTRLIEIKNEQALNLLKEEFFPLLD